VTFSVTENKCTGTAYYWQNNFKSTELVDIFSAPDESDKRFTYRFLSIQNYSFVSMLHQYFIEDCTRKLFGCQKHADRIMHWYENSEVIVDDVSAYFIQFISEYGAYFDSHLSLKQFLEK